jgi:hypothetical protein
MEAGEDQKQALTGSHTPCGNLAEGARFPLFPSADNGLFPVNGKIDIGRLSPAFPVRPPDMRVRIRRFGGLSYRPAVNLGIPSESKLALGSARWSPGESANLHGP